VAEGERTPDWKVAFAHALPGVSIVATTRATMPANFDETLPIQLVDRGKMLALPGAPLALQCVLARRGSKEELYFVGFYDDTLWRADWVVWKIDLPLADTDVQRRTKQIGCPLSASEGKSRFALL